MSQPEDYGTGDASVIGFGFCCRLCFGASRSLSPIAGRTDQALRRAENKLQRQPLSSSWLCVTRKPADELRASLSPHPAPSFRCVSAATALKQVQGRNRDQNFTPVKRNCCYTDTFYCGCNRRSRQAVRRTWEHSIASGELDGRRQI